MYKKRIGTQYERNRYIASSGYAPQIDSKTDNRIYAYGMQPNDTS